MTSDRKSAKDRAKSMDRVDGDRTSFMDESKQFNAKLNAEKRQDSQQNHVHIVVICAIYAVGLSLVSSLIVLVFHYSAPAKMHFLEPAGVAQLKDFLLHGTIGSGMTAVAKKLYK